jgi:DNA invertase Pin-like site-specific DNA recombinase
MRVAIYGRVSTTDKGQEVENQLLRLRDYIKANDGWELYKEYVDRKQGWKPDRPEFKAMYLDASQKLFDVVLFWSLDRFSREGVSKTLQYLDILRGYKIGFRSLQEPYIDTLGPFSDVVISLLATIAKFEHTRFGERVKAGLARRKSQGGRIGRAPIIFDMGKAEALHNGGMSLRMVAKHLGVKKTTLIERMRGREVNL